MFGLFLFINSGKFGSRPSFSSGCPRDSMATTAKRAMIHLCRVPSRAGCNHYGILSPQPIKSGRIGCRINHGVLSVPVPRVILNQACISPLVGKGIAARMAQHVRMRPQGKPGQFAITANGAPYPFAAEGAAPFTDKESSRIGIHFCPLRQSCLDGAYFFRF